MTLEDFFTLTEMKDGLTAPARVHELITVIQKERDSLVKSVGDATRQWAAVASTITATENKECLDLFIQLDGLLFIDRWLKDAQTFPDDASDCFVEEAISALLQAVEKLQIDNEKLTSSGICITIKSLLSYKSIRVQDKARALFDSWKAKDVDFTGMDVEKAPVNDKPKLDTQDPETQFIAKNASPTRSFDDCRLDVAEGVEIKSSNDLYSSQITSNNADSNDGCANVVALPAKLDSIADDPVSEEVSPTDGKLDPDCVTAPNQATDGVISESLKLGSLVEDAKYDNKDDLLPEADTSSNVELTSAPAVLDSKDTDTDATIVQETAAKPDMGAYDVKDELQTKTTSACDTNRSVGESSNEMVEQKGLEKGDDSAFKDQGASRATILTLGDHEHNELKRFRKSERRYLGSSCGFARSEKNSKTIDIIRQTRDMDLEDGTVDALEVARLVAKEVEREVVGSYEQSGSSASSSSSSSSSSSDGVSREVGIRQNDSPKSINIEQDMEIDGPVNQLSAMQNVPDASGKSPLNNASDFENNNKNHIQDLESSLVTDVAREPESNTEKCFWEFDLNQEFSSEDANHQVDTSSNPVSVVSASRAVVAPEMPAGPLQFEGSLGWKGSAATSAFRPASPRRASDSDRALSGGATSSGSRQRQDFLDFDLNVTEGGDDKIAIPMISKQKQVLPSVRSGESSVELSPKRSQRLKLDLNQTEDDGVLPASEWKMGVQSSLPQNCHRSPSPASSSSCMQSSMRNFDLNDNPSNCNDLSDPPAFLKESCLTPPDDTVISILGTKVKKNTFPPQTPFPFLNGRASEPMIDASLFRGGPLMGLGPAVPYPQSVFGYNGLAMGPTVSLTSAQIYRPGGPVPCVFDSRGTPFLPQMLGSASTVPPTYCQSSVVMNMMGATPGPNFTGPLPPNLDLNSGFGNAVEAGNPEPAFFRPLFIPHGQGRPSEAQLRDGFRALGSGNSGGKRKEPDSGWELYPTNYKHQQPPHL